MSQTRPPILPGSQNRGEGLKPMSLNNVALICTECHELIMSCTRNRNFRLISQSCNSHRSGMYLRVQSPYGRVGDLARTWSGPSPPIGGELTLSTLRDCGADRVI